MENWESSMHPGDGGTAEWPADLCDRAHVARIVERHAPLIRARVRRKLRPAARRLFDSQDLLSTLFRRVDALAASGNLRARSEGELVALLVKIADNALVDRHRILEKLRKLEGVDNAWACELARRVEKAVQPDGGLSAIADALEHLNGSDRTIFGLWLQGLSHESIATALDMPASTVRWRWSRIRRDLRSLYGASE